MGRFLMIAAGACILAFGGAFALYRTKLTVPLPSYQKPSRTVWLDQHWSRRQSHWFHHADQGTLTFQVPFEWFVAFEQPGLSMGPPKLLSDPGYLDRYGFIPDPDALAGDVPVLPIGFAHGGPMPRVDGTPWTNPATGAPMTGIGLTCAACHTGRFTYRGAEVLIDGGGALTDLDRLRTGLGLAVLYTRVWPYRFDRFAERLLGAGATSEARARLREELDAVWAQLSHIRSLDEGVASASVKEGYGRLDALNRIGNTVFSLDQGRPENYAGTSAPVHYPHVWDTAWFGWVQYDGSIQQPMVRNAGEALGVSAGVNLVGGRLPLFSSTVRVGTIFEMEQALAGRQPDQKVGFNGLRAPAWPEVLPPIDIALAAKGAVLYRELCQACHLAPVSSPDFWKSPGWRAPNAAGERYLDLEMVDAVHVGTDPAQATGLATRRITTPPRLGIAETSFGPALGDVVGKVVDAYYGNQQPPTPQADRERMNGNRPNGIRAPLAYEVRPLDGIWSTPPYLHNGSVPTLYALLSPVAQRPERFHLGNREYDPVNVGYAADEMSGDTVLRTSIPGNSNAGHEFNDANGPGVIGRGLRPEERRALVEYLKTL